MPEFGLEQEIPGIGIVAENSFHGTLVKHTAALGGVSAFVQPFGDGGGDHSFLSFSCSANHPAQPAR